MSNPATNANRTDTVIGRTFELMRDGQWRTLTDISSETGDDPRRIASRLRDLRMTQYGGYSIDTQQQSAYVWKYRLTGVGAVAPLANQANQAQPAAPQPTPAIPAASPLPFTPSFGDSVRFLNIYTLQPEDVDEEFCTEIPYGGSTRVVAVDTNDVVQKHLVTTQRTL